MSKESRYQSIFEVSIDAIFVINARGIIEDVNHAGLQLFGYTVEELLGKNVSMLMSEPHHSRHDGYLHNYQTTGEAKIIGIGREVRAKKKDGTEFPMRLAVSEFEDHGEIYYTGVIHDLSEEHRIRTELKENSEKLEQKVEERTARLKAEITLKESAEKALIASKNLYEAIAVNFPNGTISVLDRDLNIVFIEGAELRDSGYDTTKLIGENYLSLLPAHVAEQCRTHITKAFQGSNPVFELSYGDTVYLARTVPLTDETGETMSVLHVEINITAQKRAEEEIYKALNKEKQLNELKSRFVSLASHEFRTPLSTILSSATLIDRYQGVDQQPQRTRHVGKIKNNVQNLNMILNGFLSLEKIEEGVIKNKPREVEVREFINEMIEETEPLKKRNQKLQVHLNHKFKTAVFDPFLMKNIMINLISNAFKYSKEDGVVEIITEGDQDLTLHVRDHGIGISKAEQKQLFNRFFRANNAVNIQGTGLGLNIVRRYSEIMGATLSFESELNKGSTFSINLKQYGKDSDH